MGINLELAKAKALVAKLELLEAEEKDFLESHQLITIAQLNAIAEHNKGVSGTCYDYYISDDTFNIIPRTFKVAKDGYKGYDVMFRREKEGEGVYIMKGNVWFDIFKKLFPSEQK